MSNDYNHYCLIFDMKFTERRVRRGLSELANRKNQMTGIGEAARREKIYRDAKNVSFGEYPSSASEYHDLWERA